MPGSSSNPRSESSADKGPWVVGIDRHGGLEKHRVSPIPFDNHQPQRSQNTPSIKSQGSNLDETSPLFQKSTARIKRPGPSDQPTFFTAENTGRTRKSDPSDNVWSDGGEDANTGAKTALKRKSGMLFTDVSNTPQLFCDEHGMGGDQDPVKEDEKRAQRQNDAQLSPYVHSPMPDLQAPVASPCNKTRQTGKDAGDLARDLCCNPVRVANFAATLAALEGRVDRMPGTPEPLIRFARREYGPDVVLDWSTPAFFHPKTYRPWIEEQRVELLEKQIVSADWGRASVRMGLQSKPRIQMAELTHRKPERFLDRIDESPEKEAGSPPLTCSSTDKEPRMRPDNPTPYAARYRYMRTS